MQNLTDCWNKFGVICIPHQLLKAGESPEQFKNSMQKEQIIFDMRTEVDKASIRLNRKVKTFKQERCDIW